MKSTGNWVIALGVAIAFIGLCFLPAALGGDHSDSSLLGAGAAVFSMGILSVSAGLYLKTKAAPGLGPTIEPKESDAKARRSRGGCELCHKENPVIHCKVHQFHLCPACMSEHYDFRSCVYVPSTRRVETKPGKGAAARTAG